jgi:arabinose-5-phosphate isomerase
LTISNEEFLLRNKTVRNDVSMSTPVRVSVTPTKQLNTFEQIRLAQEVILREASALTHLGNNLPEQFCDAVTAISQTTGSLIIIGIGKAGLIGQKLVATFASTGTPAHFLHPSEAIHGDLGRIQKNDTILLLSYSGETEEITRLLSKLTSLEIPRIAITSSLNNTLARQSNIVLPLGILHEAGSLQLAPSTSTTAMLAIGDALALVVSELQQFTANDFAQFHPGGSLGRKLTSVREVMRPLAECRVAHQHQTIRDVFVASSMPGRRTGAIMLIDHIGALTGLFTDSDLARILEQSNEANFDTPIGNYMTANPITISDTKMLADAVEIFRDKRISELPVTNNADEPVGLVDITDTVSFYPTKPTTENATVIKISTSDNSSEP